jgi:hypothetical protein
MHYAPTDFGINTNIPVLIALRGKINPSKIPSRIDVERLRRLYKCVAGNFRMNIYFC